MPSPTASRTIKHIESVFLELLESKSINRMTVSEILVTAKISRATFYKYFLDKYDVLYSVQKKFLAQFSQLQDTLQQDLATEELQPTTNQPGQNYCLALTQCFYENRRLLKIMFGPTSYHDFVKMIITTVQQDVTLLLDSSPQQTQLDYRHQAALIFVGDGLLAVLARWILDDTKESCETVAATLYHFLSIQKKYLYKELG